MIQLTSAADDDDQWPGWSPDGRWLAFCRKGREEPTYGIYIISADGGAEVFYITARAATISGLTIANGVATNPGGGGIHVNNGTVTINNCTLSGNSGQAGAAIYNSSTSTLNINDSAFSGNSGPGISNSGIATITNSTFSGNVGSSISNFNVLTVTNSTFAGNSAFEGAGIASSGGTVAIANSTFSGNSAQPNSTTHFVPAIGGAIYSWGAMLMVTNSLFSGNSATQDGGIYYTAGPASNVHLTESYNLFFNNSGGDASFTLSALDVTGDPLLAPLGYYGGPTQTAVPQPNSPAFCKGTSSPTDVALPGTDQRGFLMNSSCVDIGSVQPNYTLVTNTSDTGPGSLRAALTTVGAFHNADIGFATPSGAIITLQSQLPAISGSEVNLVGPGPNNLAVSGNQQFQVFAISPNARAYISGLTIEAAGQSGISNQGVLTVSNAILTNNTSAPAVVSSGTMRLMTRMLSSNTGGAVSNNGYMTVLSSSFSSNSTVVAISNVGSLLVLNSLFSSNTGGAISNGSNVTILSSTFQNNTVNGSVDNVGNLVVNNCTFSGNAASSGASITDDSNGVWTITNTIFDANSGTYGGIYNVPTQIGPFNNIIHSGAGPGKESYNLFHNNSGGNTDFTLSSTDLTVDPKLSAPGNYGGPTPTMLPPLGSAAICAGNLALVPASGITDQRGLPRTTTYSGRSTSCLDIGAVRPTTPSNSRTFQSAAIRAP